MLVLFAVFSSYFSLCLAVFNPTNETDLSRCKVYYSRSGTTYKDFFEITKPKKKDTNLRLDFHFSVLAASDAHMLIAPSRNVQKSDAAYEIVIGAGGNTFCDIRRMQKNGVKVSERIKGLLSAVDIRSFWIHMTDDGVLEVGKEGEELAFISWKDHDPLPVSVISFSTWPGIEAKWYFDCINDDIKRIKKNLTQVERLRKNLLSNYDPYSRPVKNHSTITVVSLNPKIRELSVDEYKSILRVHGSAEISWHDEKLRWNKSEYGGLGQLKVNTMEIWKPNIILYNSVDQDVTLSDYTLLTVKHTGEISWYPSMHLNTWCSLDDYEHWPRDTRRCDLMFTFWTDFANIEIEYPNNSVPILNHQFSQWIVEEVEVLVNYGKKDDMIGTHFSLPSGPPILDLCLVMKRNPSIYNKIFLALYSVLVTTILGVFCVSACGQAKILLGCFQLILSVSCVIFLGIQLPAHSLKVPYIVQMFNNTMIAGISTIIISIFVINLSRTEKNRSMPDLVCRILTSKPLRVLLWLPEIKRNEYGKLYTFKPKDSQQYYILLGIVIDRISFIVGLGLLIFSLHSYFKY